MRRFSRRGGWSNHINRGYRSGLEDNVALQLQDAKIKVEYEKYTIDYSVPERVHHYTPDFVLPNGVIVETKGIFDVEDRKKHILIKQQHPNLDIRFVFSSAGTKIYKGSPTSYADWCKKHGFKYATKWIPEEWWKEDKKDTGGLIMKNKK